MTKQDLEVRRRTAVGLVMNGGMSYRQAAVAVNAAPSSVSLWMRMYREEGKSGLRAKPEPKPREGKLSSAQKQELASFLVEGPRAHGFENDLWSLPRIVRLVEERFDVRFHPGHMHRIVRSLGFSPQKPARRARQQDPNAVAKFRDEEWPELGKEHSERGERSSYWTKRP